MYNYNTKRKILGIFTKEVIKMKEKIYTIPINDSFDNNEYCPFCFLEDKSENDEVEYTLGPSMMEPDSRVESNEKGFCSRHLNMMIKSDKKLSLALILSTRLKHVKNETDKAEFKKTGIFSKKQEVKKLCCVICEKLEYERERYTDTFFYMLKKDSGFFKKAEKCENLCVYHGEKLLNAATKKEEFELVKKMLVKSLENNVDDLLGFIDLFDYRTKNKDSEKYKDTVKNAVNTAGGSIKNL